MRRKFITFLRVVHTGVLNFARNIWLAIAAMAVITVTLTIILFSVVTSAAFSHTISQLASKINISIYLNDNVSEQQRDDLMGELKQLSEVKNVTYVSKDEALAVYRESNASNKNLLKAVDEINNPLPASIKVDPYDPSKIDQIKKVLNDSATQQLEDPQAGTSYSGNQKVAVDNIAHATNILKRAGVIAVVVFAFISMLIIFNTIQMAIFNRRDELTIMRLLGASTWFIRGPFVVESVVYGILSAIISIAIIDVLFVVSSSTLKASSLGLLDIHYASTYFHDNFFWLLTMQLCVGIVIGAVSSIIATRRYLKFKTTK